VRLSGETLMLNELYLTMVYRPTTGWRPALPHDCCNRRDATPASSSAPGNRALRQAAQTLVAAWHVMSRSVSDLSPREIWCSTLLEFLGC